MDSDLLVEVRHIHLLRQKWTTTASLLSSPAIPFTLLTETSKESKKGQDFRTIPCAMHG